MTPERKAYLEGLAEDFALPRSAVFLAASALGESEDYDGLITSLEDLTEAYERGEWPAGAEDDPRKELEV